MTRTMAAVLALAAVACGGAHGERSTPDTDWTTVVDTIADTVVARTMGGSDSSGLHTVVSEVMIGELDAQNEYSFGGIDELEVAEDGRIYVFDNQVPTLREYDAAGKYVRTFGAKGAGPGEYTAANGLAIHRDGRVAMWDAGTARINVYRPDGTFMTSWPVPGGAGYYSGGALFVDTAGNTYARARVADPTKEATAAGGRVFGTTGLIEWDRDGRIVDSLMPPPPTVTPQSLVAASKNGGTSMTSVPFSPRHLWVWSPLGYFVSAQTDRYAVSLSPPNGQVRRIERDTRAVSVAADERAYYEESATARMRTRDPTWRWSGPSIPNTKGAIAAIVAADDGRIWVSIAQRGERVPESELPRSTTPPAETGGEPKTPAVRWRDPIAYDVFDPDGQYLGHVAAPPRTTFRTMRGDQIWAVRRDSLDVEQVVRFRVVPGFSERRIDAGTGNPTDRAVVRMALADRQ